MRKGICRFLVGLLVIQAFVFFASSPGLAETADEDVLRDAFLRHDEIADDLHDFNADAEQRSRSAWNSNLTAEEEQAVIDTMNPRFREAVLQEAYRSLEDPDGYEDTVLALLSERDMLPREQLDAFLLARSLFAYSLADELWEELLPVIDEYDRANPGVLPDPDDYMVYVEEEADGMAYSAGTAEESAVMPTEAALNAKAEEPAPEEQWEDFSTAEYRGIDENPFRSVSVSPLSTFSIDVDTAGYTKVKYDILDGYRIEKDEVKIEELINYFNFDYSADRDPGVPFVVSPAYTICPWNADHRLLRIGIRADDVQEQPDTNFVLVTDVSGSMMLINKLPLALSAYADMLDNFGENDRISLIYYAAGNGVVLEDESCADKEKIYEGLARVLFSAGGGTNGALGLNTAYDMAENSLIENGVNRVIIATDGDFNIGRTSEGDLKEIVEAGRKKGVYLTILGYGTENLKDNKMEVMAENGNGNYHYIGDMTDARKALVQESSSTLIPMADDVKIQVEFNPGLVQEYRLIGYESRILEAEDFNNDRVDAGEVGAGKSVTALYELVPAGSAGETSVPDLKYSQTETSGNDTDICTIAIRYKDVNSAKSGSASQLIEKTVLAEEFREIPDVNTALAISLAEFGMVLRDSEYRGTASLSGAEAIAQAAAEVTRDELIQSYADLIHTLREQSR